MAKVAEALKTKLVSEKMKPRDTNVQNGSVALANGLGARIGIFTAGRHGWLDSLKLFKGKS